MDEITDYSRKKKAEIEKHKWILSEKAGKDLGEVAVQDWVKRHEPDFKRYWLDNRFNFA